MSLCRACGYGHTVNDARFENFEDHARIFFALTSIQLHDHEDPTLLQLCSDCVDKLTEFDRFRDVCVQVHYGLQVKTEPEHDALKQEEADKPEGNFTDEDMIYNEESSEMEYDALAFEEVTVDENFFDFKPDPDLSTDDSYQSSSLVTPDSIVTTECVTVSIGPCYFTSNMLTDLLRSTDVGRQIIARASLGPLSDKSQKELAGIIAIFHFQSKLPTIEQVLRQYAEAITNLFKYECQETYFMARGGYKKNHSGKIYNRICNLRCKKAIYESVAEKTPSGAMQFESTSPVAPSKAFLSTGVLANLLNKSVIGRRIIESAKLGPLSNSSQNELVNIITERHFEMGFPTKHEVLQQYADAVTDLFKDERQDTYFIERGGLRRNHGGKFYHRISNLRQKAAKRKLNEECHIASLSRSYAPVKKVTLEDSRLKDAEDWLSLNTGPWEAVLHKWKASFASREKLLKNANSGSELFNKYKRLYGNEFGYELIDIDFRRLGQGNSNAIRKWTTILPGLVAYLSRSYQDDLSKAIAEHLTSADLDQDSMICAVLLLLNHEMPPTKVKTKFKPSVRIAQRDLILFAETDEQVRAKLSECEAMYASYDLPIVPKLVFRGKNFRRLTGPYEVHYKSVVYRLDSAARAIDVMVKLNTVLGLGYSRICRLIWNFVCSFVYELPVAEQYESINRVKRFLAPRFSVQ